MIVVSSPPGLLRLLRLGFRVVGYRRYGVLGLRG